MTILLLKASDSNFKEEIEISSLEDLISIQEFYSYELIFGKNDYHCEISDADYTLIIYDDYIE